MVDECKTISEIAEARKLKSRIIQIVCDKKNLREQ